MARGELALEFRLEEGGDDVAWQWGPHVSEREGKTQHTGSGFTSWAAGSFLLLG
jgi:hypothetical protein